MWGKLHVINSWCTAVGDCLSSAMLQWLTHIGICQVTKKNCCIFIRKEDSLPQGNNPNRRDQSSATGSTKKSALQQWQSNQGISSFGHPQATQEKKKRLVWPKFNSNSHWSTSMQFTGQHSNTFVVVQLQRHSLQLHCIRHCILHLKAKIRNTNRLHWNQVQVKQ